MMDLDKLAEEALKEKRQGKSLSQRAQQQHEKRKEFARVADLQVDEVYRSLIRKQTTEEQAQLKTSIKDEGIRDALVVYEREGAWVVVDGHHRLSIAKERQFASPDEARVWMLRNQLGRRNLNDAERIEIALQLTTFLEKLGMRNKQAGKNLSANLHKGQAPPKVDRLKEASKLSNVSRRNVAKYKKIVDAGDDDLRQEVIQGKKSIHKAHQEVSAKQGVKKEPSNHRSKTYSRNVEQLFKKLEAWKKGTLNDDQVKEILANALQ